jgi:hypothetical protein
MKSKVAQPIALICTFTWIGFICAISFMEAWLKFRAPGVTLPIGLGIGRLVFAALNKVEWVFAVAILISNIRTVRKIKISPFYVIVVLILILQTVWLLPALDARTLLYIEAKPVPPSSLHLYFAVAEGIKFLLLLIFGIRLFKLE